MPSTNATDTLSYNTDNPYESLFGYSRAVRKGPFIFVSGTTSLSPTSLNPTILHPGDAYQQTITALNESVKAIEKLGGKKEDVVRVRLFVRRQGDTADVGKAMKTVFGEEVGCKWAATMLVGSSFVEEEMMVEVEVDAVVL